MRTKILLCSAAVVAALLGSVGVASAAPAQVLPTCEAQIGIVDGLQAKINGVVEARVTAVARTVLFNKDVYPNDTVPTVDKITVALLGQILADPQAGGGAKTEVQQAIDALKAEADLKANIKAAIELKDRVCAPVTTTVTPPPATTTVPPVTTTVVPPPFKDIDCDDVTFAEAQRILKADPTDPNLIDTNGNGIACEAPVNVPGGTGSVETGGGPA